MEPTFVCAAENFVFMQSFLMFTVLRCPHRYANVELLTAYTDGILKGHEASEKLTEAAMEDRLEAVMKLFVYLVRQLYVVVVSHTQACCVCTALSRPHGVRAGARECV